VRGKLLGTNKIFTKLSSTSGTIVLLHDDVAIKTLNKVLYFNARDHGRLAGTKQRKTGINSRKEVE